jgi:hypothetical protein
MRRIKLVLAVAAAIAVMVVAAAPAMADVVRFDGDHTRFNNFDANNGLTIFFTSSNFDAGDFDDGSFIFSTPDFHFDLD